MAVLALGTSVLFDGRGATASPWLVPVYLDRDQGSRPWLTLITALAEVRESPKFARELKKLPNEVRREWSEKVEPMLRTDVQRCRIKSLKGRENAYSVRVHHNYRANSKRSAESGPQLRSAIGRRRTANNVTIDPHK